MAMPIVVGFGNILYGDDGVGEVVVEKIKESGEIKEEDVVFGGTDGLILANLLGKGRPVIIVDAVRTGSEPGTVHKFKVKPERLNTISNHMTTHTIGLSEVLKIVGNYSNLKDVTVIGIEPKSLQPGSSMSFEVAESISKVVELVIKEYKLYEKEKNIDS